MKFPLAPLAVFALGLATLSYSLLGLADPPASAPADRCTKCTMKCDMPGCSHNNPSAACDRCEPPATSTAPALAECSRCKEPPATAPALAECSRCKEPPATSTAPAALLSTESPSILTLADMPASQPATAPAVTNNTRCPVEDDPIDKTISTTYHGGTIFFCCKDCLPTFNKDPEKYIKKMQADPAKYGLAK